MTWKKTVESAWRVVADDPGVREGIVRIVIAVSELVVKVVTKKENHPKQPA